MKPFCGVLQIRFLLKCFYFKQLSMPCKIPDYIPGVSISSFATVIGALVEITSACLTLVFPISHGTVKKSFKNNEKK